jgi:flagella basal body P-ring formation protein FlgA
VPLVRANDVVTVYSRVGGVSVRTLMKAREDGALGEAVALTSLDARGRVLARVTGYHEAEVISTGGTEAAGPSAVAAEPPPSRRR